MGEKGTEKEGGGGKNGGEEEKEKYTFTSAGFVPATLSHILPMSENSLAL